VEAQPILLPVVGWLVLWLWTLYDAGRYSDAAWHAAGESRAMWLLLILVLQFFGTLFYLLWVRPKLRFHEQGAAS
jgi:hypothetical protein